AEATFRAAGREPSIEYFDMPEGLRAKYQYFTQASMAKLRAAGYPGQFTPLEEGVRRYVQDFLSAPDRYR
ncbi:MAG TPA: ADP-glyceromanno-heptose 6-epimerase, partial [Alphaproteobacteria bacterium]|nr:ADP-glyceromanno-heptose 6-epimerase [Alphaproteobacteria bacterium]